MSALALFFFGGEVLHGFAFTMIVGIVTGTYSSVFVAAAIVTFWRRTKPSKLTSATTAPVATPAAARKAKAQRKARAS
jgi:preprotein translocase subunit SecF